MLTNNVNFCVDQNIIYFSFSGDFNKNFDKLISEEAFFNSISKLTNGRYMPMIVNLEDVSFFNAIKIFRFLAFNKRVKSLVLSQIFLVQSTILKYIISIYNLNNDPVVKNRVCNDLEIAVYYCNRENKLFNALN